MNLGILTLVTPGTLGTRTLRAAWIIWLRTGAWEFARSGESRDDLRLNNLLPVGMNSFAFKLSAHEGGTCVSFICFFLLLIVDIKSVQISIC